MWILAYLGHDVTSTWPWPELTWDQIFKLTFQCQKEHVSNRLDEVNTMVSLLFSYLPYQQVINGKIISMKNVNFPFDGLGSQTVDLMSNLIKKTLPVHEKGSQMHFWILLSYHTFEDNSDCLRKNHNFLKILHLVTSGDLNIDLTWKWPI